VSVSNPDLKAFPRHDRECKNHQWSSAPGPCGLPVSRRLLRFPPGRGSPPPPAAGKGQAKGGRRGGTARRPKRLKPVYACSNRASFQNECQSKAEPERTATIPKSLAALTEGQQSGYGALRQTNIKRAPCYKTQQGPRQHGRLGYLGAAFRGRCTVSDFIPHREFDQGSYTLGDVGCARLFRWHLHHTSSEGSFVSIMGPFLDLENPRS